jgi:hypothetical protein
LPPYAPGCLPIIGHLLALASKEAPESLFLKWSKEVGPVFTLKFGIKRWVILNDSTSVNDLIVNRGTIYSSRDISSVMVQDVFDGGKCQALELKVYVISDTKHVQRRIRRRFCFLSVWQVLEVPSPNRYMPRVAWTAATNKKSCSPLAVYPNSSHWLNQKENQRLSTYFWTSYPYTTQSSGSGVWTRVQV